MYVQYIKHTQESRFTQTKQIDEISKIKRPANKYRAQSPCQIQWSQTIERKILHVFARAQYHHNICRDPGSPSNQFLLIN